MNDKLIKKIIDDNYSVFKAFDVADGNISLSEYFKHITNRRKYE